MQEPMDSGESLNLLQTLRQWISTHPALAHLCHQKMAVSVSGGRDSMTLLKALAYLREELGLDLEAVHFNFGLRGEESLRDESVVSAFCQAETIPCTIQRCETMPRCSSTTASRSAIQEWARQCRLTYFKTSPHASIWEAHHREDQIETFLFRLFRGSGLDGLRAMQAVSHREGKPIVRPFLTWPRKDLEQLAKDFQIPFVDDSTNFKSDYSRNFIRHEILPKIEERFPTVRQKILGLIEEIQEYEEVQELREQEWLNQNHRESGKRQQDEQPQSKLQQTQQRERRVALNRPDPILSPSARVALASLKRQLRSRLLKDYGIVMSREKTEALAQLVYSNEPFFFNAPKNLQIHRAKRGESLRFRVLSSSTRGDLTL